jgi:hypothetical protein
VEVEADTHLSLMVVLAAQAVEAVAAVIITPFMLLFMDSTVNRLEIMHIRALITQVVVVVEADIMQITPTALVVVVVLELLLLDTNRKNYERNTKN